MYLTSLPDHSRPDFDEDLHFRRFKMQNVVFNTVSSYSFCDDHVGCLSFKTILKGEEWYGINKRKLAIRPGQFLILNDEQNYSCKIDTMDKVRGLSVFFQKDFAAQVFQDTLKSEVELLDNPFYKNNEQPEFFQTLNDIDPELQLQLARLISGLENNGYDDGAEEQLLFLLSYLIKTLKSDTEKIAGVSAIKPSSKIEIYRRLCIAKDFLHSTFMEKPDLKLLGSIACLSVPQLIRQFKSVFKVTPHQYLIQIKLKQAVDLLKNTDKPIHEITWACGFENASAFCRAFKSAYGFQPLMFRKTQA
ncbi:helix-turn-helix transcriptional regulator [Pedobacter sp. ISL-68]|uniref:helix-turn-helix domain-containing protein n=1 Tax=unclassified Pedobacter TaxID=2628915 RepID=UPI001BE9D9EA|nr:MULTISPECIES: AraC family transcriptional regulator [unclassified Pedobacter]MBT2560512.1 helix-turn-helix transcriptional regulator [Pedobacter sp. ISL-64]MBT2593245.1 helix-turn-helix transcriptional regulator [Pedobacter sp. ISL-68]